MSVCGDCKIKPTGIGYGAVICTIIGGEVNPLTSACYRFVERKEYGPDISLRNFFAGCALMGAIVRGVAGDDLAQESFVIADAMLKAQEED